MHRIDSPGSTQDNRFTEGNPSTGVPATEVAAAWLNSVQEEIAAVIEAAGIQLADSSDDPQNQLLAALGGLAPSQNIVVFDTPGITEWDVPAVLRQGQRKAHVTVIGGGAGGNPPPTPETGGGGGGAGGYSYDLLDLTDIDSVTVTVGNGGGAGIPGGSSSFGSYCSATGGETGGGQGGGQGGTGSGGAINMSLGSGFRSAQTIEAGAESGGQGGGIGGGRGLANVPSGPGGAPGAGGGGSGSGTNPAAGTGAGGVVVVRW